MRTNTNLHSHSRIIINLICRCALILTHIHTCTLILTQLCTCALISDSHMRNHINLHSHMRTNINSLSHLRTNINSHSHLRTNINLLSHMRTNINAHSHLRTNINLLSQMRTNINSLSHLRTNINSNSHLRTNINLLSHMRTNMIYSSLMVPLHRSYLSITITTHVTVSVLGLTAIGTIFDWSARLRYGPVLQYSASSIPRTRFWRHYQHDSYPPCTSPRDSLTVHLTLIPFYFSSPYKTHLAPTLAYMVVDLLLAPPGEDGAWRISQGHNTVHVAQHLWLNCEVLF